MAAVWEVSLDRVAQEVACRHRQTESIAPTVANLQRREAYHQPQAGVCMFFRRDSRCTDPRPRLCAGRRARDTFNEISTIFPPRFRRRPYRRLTIRGTPPSRPTGGTSRLRSTAGLQPTLVGRHNGDSLGSSTQHRQPTTARARASNHRGLTLPPAGPDAILPFSVDGWLTPGGVGTPHRCQRTCSLPPGVCFGPTADATSGSVTSDRYFSLDLAWGPLHSIDDISD